MRSVKDTPGHAQPVAPTDEEMHPQLHHQTAAKPHNDARWLGFSAMGPHTEPPKRVSKIALAQATPSRATNGDFALKSPDFRFTFHREQSLELSPEAKKLMNEKRAEAARIKDMMRANGETSNGIEASGRKLAMPKSQRSRFSGVHSAQFQKMDSIAGHASAYRKDPKRQAAPIGEGRITTPTPSKSLKRSPSKAELDKKEPTPSKVVPRTQSHAGESHFGTQLPRLASAKDVGSRVDHEPTSPSKRVKRVEVDDASSTRPTSSSGASAPTSTPQKLSTQKSQSNLAHLTTPTQSSLARAASVKSTQTSKIPAPALPRSPSKPELVSNPTQEDQKASTPLLAKSPSKGGIFGIAGIEKPSHLMSRMMSPSLVRSAAKSGFTLAKETSDDNHLKAHAPQAPLLARSPLKMPEAKVPESGKGTDKPSSIALFSRSPARAPLGKNPFNSLEVSDTAVGSSQANLFGRFNLLRSSPMKSILRSPQRLYSDDPAKVAAGTHLATPPKFSRTKKVVPNTAPVQKHVDFSSSTKAREASKEASSSPSTAGAQKSTNTLTSTHEPSNSVKYPDLEPTSPAIDPWALKRRQTGTPRDFTFRAGTDLVFAPSPSPSKTLASPAGNRTPTIRHVAADAAHASAKPEPHATGSKKRKIDFEDAVSAAHAEASPTVTLGSKKRKFDFENDAAEAIAGAEFAADKENASVGAVVEAEDRPAKRFRADASASPVFPAVCKEGKDVKRRPTLGVRPRDAVGRSPEKKEKKAGARTISMARLNALAMPKKRN